MAAPVLENAASENGSSSVVKVTKKGMVLPFKAPENKDCPLVTFDLPYITFYYNQKLLLYKNAGDGTEQVFEERVEKLKEGLARALVDFYPLAGNLALDEEGILRVECDGESLVGVEVVEAEAEGVQVSQLADGDAPEFLQDIVPYSGVMNLEGLHSPLMAVQITKLKDGVAIGCAFNHAILDGASTWHFMGAWAELCRGESISVIPFHDRTKARNTRVKLDLPESAAAHEKADPSLAMQPPKILREKIFSFSEKAVEKIKADVNASNDGEEGSKPFSTFQSLGVHVWRAVCRARKLKPEDYTVFAIFTDCRRRLDPPMPESYFGNLIQAIFTVTASGLLLQSPSKFGAGLLQKVINSHDAEAIDTRSKEWEAAPKLFHYRDAGINCVAVGSSPRFRVYDVDFGFGKPERVRSGNNNKFDGMMYLYQGRDSSRSVDVELTLDVDALEEIGKDDEFLVTGITSTTKG